MDERFMRERPVLPLLTSMALPMVISMLANSLYNIVDSFFVAKIRRRTSPRRTACSSPRRTASF